MTTLLPQILPGVLIGLFLLSRLPGFDTRGFSLAYALCFCAGAFPRLLSIWVVAGAILASDLWLNVHYAAGIITDWQMVNYLAFGLIWLLGRQCRDRRSPWHLLFGGLLGALVFYILSNTAAWMANPQYVKSLSGWWQAVTTGLPGWPPTWTFFRNTMISGGLFTVAAGALLSAVQPVEPETDEVDEEETAPDNDDREEPVRA
jgi:hypothetical protein